MESSGVDYKQVEFVEGNTSTGNEIEISSLDDASPISEQLFSEDTAKMLQFLPEEVWRLVTGKMKYDNLINCVNSSLFFWELKRKDRIFYLFPNVIRIMAPLFEKRKLQMQVCNQNEEGIRQRFSIERLMDEDQIKEAKAKTAAAKLWRSTVLNCRLVCFTWNRAVERCYERAEMTGIKEFVNDFDPRSPLNTMNIDLTLKKFTFFPQFGLLKTFMEHFEESHGLGIRAPTKNPFFGRSVLIHTRLVREQQDDFLNELDKMLELFGGFIWYCELGVSPQQVVFDLQRILNRMPNLKYLKLVSFVRHPPRENYVPVDLPRLENLQVLSLEFLESSLATELIRRNGHVKQLTFYSCEVDDNVGSVLTNLKGYSTNTLVGGDEILARYGNQWKLNSVKIWPRHDDGAVVIFPLLNNNWAETLTDVTLEHPFTRDEDNVYEQSKSYLLTLPGVRRLSILSEHIFFLDFMEPLNKNLEHLEIFPQSCYDGTKHWERVKCEQKIEWVGFKEEMNRSNIWKLFGKLKTIKILFSHCGVSRRREMVFTNEGQKMVYFEQGNY